MYATDKKQTKVEVFEARIYEEAMNILLKLEQPIVCGQCRGMSVTLTDATSTTTPISLNSSTPTTPTTFTSNSNNLLIDVMCTSLLRQHLKIDNALNEEENLVGMNVHDNGVWHLFLYI